MSAWVKKIKNKKKILKEKKKRRTEKKVQNVFFFIFAHSTVKKPSTQKTFLPQQEKKAEIYRIADLYRPKKEFRGVTRKIKKKSFHNSLPLLFVSKCVRKKHTSFCGVVGGKK